MPQEGFELGSLGPQAGVLPIGPPLLVTFQKIYHLVLSAIRMDVRYSDPPFFFSTSLRCLQRVFETSNCSAQQTGSGNT